MRSTHSRALCRRTSPMPNKTALTAEAPGLHLDGFIPYRLSVLSNRVSTAIANIYSERFGLTIPEWRVMAVLGGSPHLSAREVAERTAMDKVQVSRAVARLLGTKRLQRETDDDDGRITRLSLSTKGRAIYDEIVPLALGLEEQFLSALTPVERRNLDALITKLSRRARLFIGRTLS
jgi:DNA-binding MarR family transcriptional regulator